LVKKSIYFSFFSFLPSICHNQPGVCTVGGSAHHRVGGRLAAATSNSVHPARHNLVLWGSGREGPRSAAKWSAPLETKFLRFWTRQERDGVLSLPPQLAPSPWGFGDPGRRSLAWCPLRFRRPRGGPAAPTTPSPEPATTRAGFWRPAHGRSGKGPGNGSNGRARTPSLLFHFGEGVQRPVAFVAGAFFLLCAGGAKAAGATPPGRVWWRFAQASRIGQAPAGRPRAARQAGGGQSMITSIGQNPLSAAQLPKATIWSSPAKPRCSTATEFFT
jgi:hypothetical protein